MTHKKRPSTEKMYDYKKEKVEFARELGVNGANNTEVNAKMAAQDEAKYSKETMNRKHRFVNPQDSENHRYYKEALVVYLLGLCLTFLVTFFTTGFLGV